MRTVILVLVLAVAAPVPALAQTPQAVTLDAAMRMAVDRHPSVVAAARSLEAAQARLTQARAGTAPQVSVTGRASVGTLGVTGTPTGGDVSASHNVAVGASVPLYDGGITAQQVAQAQAAVEAAQASLAATRQDVALTAAQAYFQVLRAQRTVEVREAAVRTAQAQLAQAEAFFRAGTAAQADVIRARAAVASAQAELVAARGQVEISLAALRSALALPPGAPISVADPSAPAVQPLSAAEAAAEAARQRPEVLRADADVRGTQAAVRLAEIRAGAQVTVSAGGTVQVTPDPGQAGWSVSATVSHPLFDGGRTKAAVEEARANLQAAQARREATLLAIQSQAVQAAVSVNSAAARVEATRVSAEAGEEALRVSDGRYRAGVGTLVEVLDAQSSATQARIGAVQALFDLHLAVVSQQHALGRPLVARP